MERYFLVVIVFLSSLLVNSQPGNQQALLRKAIGMGNTYGMVAVLMVENPTPDSLDVVLSPVVIPGGGNVQSYVIPFATSIIIPPSSTIPVALYGYCLDPGLSARPLNELLANPSTWYWVREPNIPRQQDLMINDSVSAPCIPGTIFHFPERFHDLESAAPVVVAYASLLHQMADQDLYLPPGIPLAEAVQQAIWMTILPLTGSEYTQQDAISYWHRLAGQDTILSASPDFIAGTERIWQSALLLSENYLCCDAVQAYELYHKWNTMLLAAFTNDAIPVEDDHTTAPVPKVPSLSPVPPQPPVPPGKQKGCAPEVMMEVSPYMDGGLNPKSVGTFKLRHLQPLPLVAEGADADVIVFFCNPNDNCPETPSYRREGLTSRVRYLWTQLDGPGHFTEDGTDTSMTSENKSVLWYPPDLTGIITAGDTTVVTHLRLTILDDLPGQPTDLPVVREIVITTRRDTTMRFDSLKVEVKGEAFQTYMQPEPVLLAGTCLAETLQWNMNEDLKPPLVTKGIPLFRSRQRVVLKAIDQRDPDELKLKCTTSCDNLPLEMILEDEVIFVWRLIGNSKGYFLEGHDAHVVTTCGKEVIFEAPEMKADELRKEVYIEVKAYNQGSYPGLYYRMPALAKEDDIIAKDTLHIQVDCNPNPNQAPALVVITWTDKLLDHDDPDNVETLKDASYTIPVNILADDCEPMVDPALNERTLADGSEIINPKVQDHNPQKDDMWDGFTICVSIGNYLFIVDFGIIVDHGFIEPATDEEMTALTKITKETLKLLINITVLRGILSAETKSVSDLEMYNDITDMILKIIVQGQLPVDSPLFEDVLKYYMKKNPGLTREEALAKMQEEFIGINKGWENNETVKKFEIGMIYSLWIIVSHPTSCMQSCPVAVDYFTWISLGDTDHYYQRSCTIQVVRWENNQPHNHIYNFHNEKKGADFD